MGSTGTAHHTSAHKRGGPVKGAQEVGSTGTAHCRNANKDGRPVKEARNVGSTGTAHCRIKWHLRNARADVVYSQRPPKPRRNQNRNQKRGNMTKQNPARPVHPEEVPLSAKQPRAKQSRQPEKPQIPKRPQTSVPSPSHGKSTLYSTNPLFVHV